MSEQEKNCEQRFLDYLAAHSNDRGMMADLRRGFSQTQEYRSWPYLASWCNLTNEHKRILYQTVAGAYAHHPVHTTKGNMGTALRQLAMGEGKGEDGLKSFDGRFRRMLICNSSQEICFQIAGVILALAAKGIPINYPQLFTDLRFWGKRVKINWAQAYWGGNVEEV